MWTQPYSYQEGTAISMGLLITGGLLQVAAGPLNWMIFVWPGNIVTLAFLLVALVVIYLLRSRFYFLRFITTPQAAVPALATAAVLTVIMGLTRQVPENRSAADPIGLTKMLNFWPFILIYLWNVIIVGEVAIRQVCHFQKRHIPSLTCHTGLFIFIVCGTLGSADMQKLKMYCEEGQPEWRALDAYNNVVELPFAIQLNRFTIDEYPPKLMVVSMSTGLPQPADKPQTLVVDKGTSTSGTLLGWNISISKYLDNAMPSTMMKMMRGMPEGMASRMKMDQVGMRLNEGGFESYKGKGAATAVYVVATKGKARHAGWVSSGSYLFPISGVSLSGGLEIVMPNREPMRYASNVNIYTQKDELNIPATIEVNQPYSLGDWKIYQLSYNEQMGKWSNVSVFELVKDPWLPYTYVGLFLLMAGALLMFIQKR